MSLPPDRTRPSPVQTILAKCTDEQFIRAFARYLLVGGASYLAYNGLAKLFRDLEIHYLAAGAIAFVLATGLNYVLSARFAFQRGSKSEESKVALVYLVSLVGLAATVMCLWFLVDVMTMEIWIATALSAGVAFAWNFLTRYFWIFAK